MFKAKSTIITTLLCLLFLQGCSKNYSIKNFTKLTGKEWNSLSQEEKIQYKSPWDNMTKNEQKRLYLIYGNDSEMQQELEHIDYESIPQEDKIECQTYFPWINLENPSQGDKTLIKYVGFAIGAIQR